MDVGRLEVLRELKLRGSVTAVAAATNRTPSAVSQQLKTAAADVVVAIARAEETWRTYLASPEGRVELATFPTAGRMFLPGLLRAAREVPGLQVVATDVDPTAADFARIVPDFDVVIAHAVGPAPSWADPDLITVRLLDEPLDVALPVDHPLAAGREVTPAQIAGERWIGVPDDFPFERLLGEIERVAGSPLTVVQRFSDTRVTESLVAAGEGLAVLPRFTSGGEGSGVVLRPLAQLAPTRRIAALLRRENAERPSVRVVLEALRAIAADLGR